MLDAVVPNELLSLEDIELLSADKLSSEDVLSLITGALSELSVRIDFILWELLEF